MAARPRVLQTLPASLTAKGRRAGSPPRARPEGDASPPHGRSPVDGEPSCRAWHVHRHRLCQWLPVPEPGRPGNSAGSSARPVLPGKGVRPLPGMCPFVEKTRGWCSPPLGLTVDQDGEQVAGVQEEGVQRGPRKRKAGAPEAQRCLAWTRVPVGTSCVQGAGRWLCKVRKSPGSLDLLRGRVLPPGLRPPDREATGAGGDARGAFPGGRRKWPTGLPGGGDGAG